MAKRDLIPATRPLPERAAPKPRGELASTLEHRADVLAVQAYLADQGNQVLAEMSVRMNGVFRNATGRVLEANEQLRSNRHRQLCDAFAESAVKELATGLIENNRLAEAHVKSVTAAKWELDVPKPAPVQERRPTTVEE